MMETLEMDSNKIPMGMIFKTSSCLKCLFFLCPHTSNPVLDVTSDIIFVYVTFIIQVLFCFCLQRIVINRQKRQRKLFTQPSYTGNDVRTNTRASDSTVRA